MAKESKRNQIDDAKFQPKRGDRMEYKMQKRLNEILRLLASEAEIQSSAFPAYVHVQDEIAMETDDMSDLLKENGCVDSSSYRALTTVLDLLTEMEGQEQFWTDEGLREHKVWQAIRDIANKELADIKLPYKKPNLFWLHFIESK